MQGQRRVPNSPRKRLPQVRDRDEVGHGRVCEIHPEDGFGRIETPDGRVIYFDRSSVRNHSFHRLTTGTEVRFARRAGDRPPMARVVQMI